MVGQRTAQACSGDDVSDSERPNSVERSVWILGKGLWVGVADPFDRNQWKIGKILELFYLEKLLWGADHSRLQTCAVGILLQFERVPLPRNLANRLGIIRTPEKCQSPSVGFRIDVQQLYPATVSGGIHVGRHERICWIVRSGWRVAIQQLPFQIIERAEPMGSLAEVDGQVLTLSGSISPEIGDSDRLRHQRDARHHGQRPRTPENGVFPEKRDLPPAVRRIESYRSEHIEKLLVRIQNVVGGNRRG